MIYIIIFKGGLSLLNNNKIKYIDRNNSVTSWRFILYKSKYKV